VYSYCIILKSASTLDWYGNALKLLRLLSELLPFLPHQSLLIYVISSLQRETSQGWNSIRFSDAGPTNAIKVPCRGSFLSIEWSPAFHFGSAVFQDGSHPWAVTCLSGE
jgi:hypothetical protein